MRPAIIAVPILVPIAFQLLVPISARSDDLLEEDHGMLLVFPREKELKIWMLNTPLPLDVGFFDRHGVLINSLSMEPDGGAVVHHSDAPALFALEMNQGWFKRNGIGKGARLNLPHAIVGRD